MLLSVSDSNTFEIFKKKKETNGRRKYNHTEIYSQKNKIKKVPNLFHMLCRHGWLEVLFGIMIEYKIDALSGNINMQISKHYQAKSASEGPRALTFNMHKEDTPLKYFI